MFSIAVAISSLLFVASVNGDYGAGRVEQPSESASSYLLRRHTNLDFMKNLMNSNAAAYFNGNVIDSSASTQFNEDELNGVLQQLLPAARTGNAVQVQQAFYRVAESSPGIGNDGRRQNMLAAALIKHLMKVLFGQKPNQ